MTTPFRIGIVGISQQAAENQIRAGRTLANRNVEAASFATPDRFEQMVHQMGLDGVVIAMPAGRQCETALRAFANGLDVFCEAPLGNSAAEAQRMIAAAKDAGRVLGTSYRYPPRVERTMSSVRDGAIGAPQQVKLSVARRVDTSGRGPMAGHGFWKGPDGRGPGVELAGDLCSVIVPLLPNDGAAVAARALHKPIGGSDDSYAFEDRLEVKILGDRELWVVLTVALATGSAELPEDYALECDGREGDLTASMIVARGEDRFPAHLEDWIWSCRGKRQRRSLPGAAVVAHGVLEAAHLSSAEYGRLVTVDLNA